MRVEIPNQITVTIGGLISRGVKAAEVTDEGKLVFTLTDGSTIDLGSVVGPEGKKGDTGDRGEQGQKGDAGASITSIEKKSQSGTAAAYTVTLSDGTSFELEIETAKGADGKDGTDGVTPHIGENGNWYLGETDTGKSSRGEQGEAGPNEITTGTDTEIAGLMKGADGKVAQAVAGTDYATPAQLAAKQNALNINLANVGNMIRVDQVSAYVATKFAVAKAGQDYMKTGNIVKQTLVSTPTTPSEEYAINWQYG